MQVEKKDRKRSFRGGIVGKESDKSGCGHTTPQASAVMGAGSVKFVVVGKPGVVMESGFAQAAQFPEVKGGRLDNTGRVAAVARPWHRRIVRERAE